MIVVLMGVSGSGKTMVGRLLAGELGWTFVDADAYHPATNVEKMRRGIALNDDDRRPWLEALRRRIHEARGQGENVVLACSALKHAYQEYLQDHDPAIVRFIYLRGSEDLIRKQLAARRGHFMNPDLLHSQFETLEPPENALPIDVDADPEEIVGRIRRGLGI
jgi:gluconokinase